MGVSRNSNKWMVAAAVTTLMSTQAVAQEPAAYSARWDVALELPTWPALGDLQPASGGSFDSVGFGISGAWHMPVKAYARSDLLVGVEGSIAATGSNIPGIYEDLIARLFVLGLSTKWLLGDARNVSIDTGVAYYEADIADVDTSWWGSREYEYWRASKGGAFLGMTWDIGAGLPGRSGGLSLGLRAHFVDFGTVDGVASLDGPIYALRIAYSAR